MNEGDKCTEEGCDGMMTYPPVIDCHCHICTPCSRCVNNKLTCTVCGKEIE